MKFRLRSLQSKETVKLEVPNDCNLQQLKETLSLALSPPPPTASSSLRFSLNRKDELLSSSLQDSLLSLGITSGDLIYFSLNPDDFSPSRQSLGSNSVQERAQGNFQAQSINFQESNSGKQKTLDPDSGISVQPVIQVLDANIRDPRSKKCEISREFAVLGPNFPSQDPLYQDLSMKETTSVEAGTSNNETLIQESPEQGQSDLHGEVSDTQMGEIQDGMDIDAESLDMGGKRISQPYFLKRVLREELGDYLNDNKLLFIAIHAVFLESGFIGFDSVSGLRVDVFHFLEEQSSMSFTTSVSYTLPELLFDNNNVTESVVLKFQTLGHFVNVYGCLTKSQSWLHKLCLNKYKFVPAISFLWANCHKSDKMDESEESSYQNEIFDLWKVVKDELAYPLLIDICEKTGLDLPPCLMRLPADLKLKILESLPGVDIARMASVCKEMRYLSSNNDLWKQKYTEEFGSKTEVQGTINWKTMFISSWEHKKKRKRGLFVPSRALYHVREDANPFGILPRMRGGVYDWLPGGIQPNYALRNRNPLFYGRRNFAPNCNLGGFNA